MKRLPVIFVFLNLSFVLTLANGLITNVPGRETTSLNGKWHVIIDWYGNGYYDSYLRPKDNGYFLNAKAEEPGDRIEYNFDTSPLLDVPGDWNTQMKELFYYDGIVWYKKSFDYQKKEGKRVFLHFGAVNYHAKVFLNGSKIGEHTGGYTPFQFEITDSVKNGGNFLVVLVDNSRTRDAVPTLKTDWWNYGGITRSVEIIETPVSFVRDYLVQLKKGDKETIEGWFKVEGTTSVKNIVLNIPELGINEVYQTNKEGIAEFALGAAPELWSPGNPKLYEVIISMGQDTIEDLIGFRTIETSGNKILLNGEPVFLKGVCLHEEAPFRSGRAYSEEDALVLLGWAKELGCNFVRLAHYPHGEYMTRMADKMGLMLWSEIPIYWAIQWENKSTLQHALTMLSDNITRDRNRASIIIWSVANETPKLEERTVFLKALVDKARALDDTRLISAALHHSYYGDNKRGLDDPFAKELDVLGFNQYQAWYGSESPSDLTNSSWTFEFDKPHVISEFGGGALQGYHGPKEQRWTEEYQEWLYRENLKMIEKMDNIAGISPWILVDFRSPNRVLPDIQDGFNRKGLISDEGIRKKAFYVLQEWFKQKEK